MAEEPGIGRGRVAELGACMADLIASDFEALEAAGLRCAPGRGGAATRCAKRYLDVDAAVASPCGRVVNLEADTRISAGPPTCLCAA